MRKRNTLVSSVRSTPSSVELTYSFMVSARGISNTSAIYKCLVITLIKYLSGFTRCAHQVKEIPTTNLHKYLVICWLLNQMTFLVLLALIYPSIIFEYQSKIIWYIIYEPLKLVSIKYPKAPTLNTGLPNNLPSNKHPTLK